MANQIKEVAFYIELVEKEIAELEQKLSNTQDSFIKEFTTSRINNRLEELEMLKGKEAEINAQSSEVGFTMTVDKNRIITLTADGVEVAYKEMKEGSGIIVRRGATVQGYAFNEAKDGYWKKSGRGSVKNRKEIEQVLIKADSYIVSEGYDFFNYQWLR